jgi:hypothetical protein
MHGQKHLGAILVQYLASSSQDISLGPLNINLDDIGLRQHRTATQMIERRRLDNSISRVFQPPEFTSKLGRKSRLAASRRNGDRHHNDV